MKNYIAASVLAFMALSSAAQAHPARVVSVQPIYQHQLMTVPVARCSEVYGNVPSSSGDVLAGAIIGGIIGKELADHDRGAIAGAIIGGAIANNGRTQDVHTNCYTEYVEEFVKTDVLDFYVVTVQHGREFIEFETQEYYEIGEVVRLRGH